MFHSIYGSTAAPDAQDVPIYVTVGNYTTPPLVRSNVFKFDYYEHALHISVLCLSPIHGV